jgi:hypothetical protein
MPEVLADDDLSPLAAEYVLGTLDADERTRASVLFDVDPKFRDMVRLWERRLGELHLMVEPVVPNGKIWQRIKGKLGDVAVAPPSPDRPSPDRPSFEKPLEVETKVRPPEPKPEFKPEFKLESEFKPKPEEPVADEAKVSDPKVVSPAPERMARGGEAPLQLPPTPTLPPPRLESFPNLDEVEVLVPPPPPPSPPKLTTALVPEPSRSVVRRDEDVPVHPRPARGLRAFAVLMTVVAFALAGLIAAWRFIPDRLPHPLRPTVVLHMPDDDVGSTPRGREGPPPPPFDE